METDSDSLDCKASRLLCEIQLLNNCRDQRLSEFVTLMQGPIYGYIRQLTKSDADAEDATQQTLMSIWKAVSQYDPKRPAKPWIFKIARNAALRIIDAKKNELSNLVDSSSIEPPAPEANRLIFSFKKTN